MPDPSSLGTIASGANPVGLAVQGGLGLAQTVAGLINNEKAKREAKELERSRPKYDISPLAQEGLDLAESELASGMSGRAESAYKDLENRQLAGSLGTILKGGGSLNNVADVFDSSGAGRLRLAQLEDQIRMQQIENLRKSREYMVDQEDKAFMYNVDAPWKDKAQANAAAREQATKGIWNGLQTMGSGVMNYAQGKEASNIMNDFFAPIGLPSTRTGNISDTIPKTIPPPNKNPTIRTNLVFNFHRLISGFFGIPFELFIVGVERPDRRFGVERLQLLQKNPLVFPWNVL